MKSAGFKQVSSFSLTGAVAALGLLCAVGLAAAQGTPQQQQACSGDAQRLCGEFIGDAMSGHYEKISACMKQKHAQLSAGCKAAYATPTTTHKHRPTRRRT